MFTLPKLGFEFNDLEPHIDAKTMEIHYTKHHQGYADKLNIALQGQENLLKMTIEEILKNVEAIPDNIRQAVVNNGGGFYNHNIFWSILSPEGGAGPTGAFNNALMAKYENLEVFKDQFGQAATARFGSGWAWLVIDENKNLEIMSSANQDCPLSVGQTPILTLDVWEHAYYLNYQNRRPDYIAAFWNVVNWAEVERRYESAR